LEAITVSADLLGVTCIMSKALLGAYGNRIIDQGPRVDLGFSLRKRRKSMQQTSKAATRQIAVPV
jgi:hypothetical protein